MPVVAERLDKRDFTGARTLLKESVAINRRLNGEARLAFVGPRRSLHGPDEV
jgi:hypothetical protein